MLLTNNSILQHRLVGYIHDSRDPIKNFTLGVEYERLGHTASAVSFYVRTAEFGGRNSLLIYEALLRIALCFSKQGARVFVTKGILLRAISLLPNRPEAHFLLCRCYEWNKDWQEAYTWAVLGEKLDIKTTEIVPNVEYPGKYGFTYERAVAGWWIGLYDESIHLFRQLKKHVKMLDIHINSVNNNIARLGNTWRDPILYKGFMYDNLRFKFNGADTIKQNHSQCFQDMFVLTMLNGKRNGRFLEIGCGDPFFGNNTALLEREFGWTGLSIDINEKVIEKFKKERKAETTVVDASTIDYSRLLRADESFDYLQIDIEPPLASLKVLKKILFDKYKFAVITFEHDDYADYSNSVQVESRKYLESKGYLLVVPNIAPDNYMNFEDWWVYPDLVDKDIIEKMMSLSDNPQRADDYMLNKY